ncbi:N-acetylglucosamine-specific PTS transporter subunit IIBC [Hutsoniella sourekii]
MLRYLQQIGRSLMLPVSVLVVASLLMGAGYALDPQAMSGSSNSVAVFLVQAGLVVIGNLPILFAVGIGMGLARDNNGAASLSSVVAYLIITKLLQPEMIASYTGAELDAIPAAFASIENVFIGIIAGIVGGEAYNRFQNTELPQWLAFFSGRRSVPIVSALIAVILTLILYFVWPVCYNALVGLGTAISSLGALGAGLYGFFNKLLIPFGLHHAINNVFWFDTIGINDIGNFWGGTGTLGVTGMYQAGFFPIMMFGLPGAALAMYRNARPENRGTAGALLLAGAIASFSTGITEPIEFSFMFLAPGLYLVHAILTGISMFVAALLHATAGFSFSAGLIDFLLSWRMPMSHNQIYLIGLGLVMFVVYYLVFDFCIKKFDLDTPGRGSVQASTESEKVLSGQSTKHDQRAQVIYEGLGGADNILEINNCATRLRLKVRDSQKVDSDKIKSAPVPGVSIVDKENVQVIIGTEVQFVADALKKINQSK